MNPQTVFKLLSAVVTFWAIPTFKSVWQVIESRQAEDAAYPRLSDMWPVAIIGVGIMAVRWCVTTWMKPWARRVIPKGALSSRAHEMKAHRMTITAFKAIFFTFSAAFGFFALRGEVWTPPALGGSGSTAEFLTGYPFQVNSEGVRWYYFLCGAYHLNLLFDLIVETPFPDFWEDTLRASVGALLISFSYLSNFLRIGSLILLIHDITDTLTCGCKMFVMTEYKVLTVTLFLSLLLSWVYLRLWCYSMLVLYPIFAELRKHMVNSLFHGKTWLLFCLFVLLMLNIYWFLLMLRMLAHFVLSGKATDMHAKLSEGDEETSPAASASTTLKSNKGD
eukprot:GHVN01012522.1.p1 GENE.GHVN01012522.1~~GHVN01012522.1.p1  ORF type:complete len:334 (+),score=32.25 GHVN01012522.1:683-1684(+)